MLPGLHALQVCRVKARGIRQNRQKPLFFSLVLPYFIRLEAAFGKRNVGALREKFDRVRKVQRFDLLDERDDVSARAAAETVVKLIQRVDAKRRRLFMMKGTSPPKVLAFLFQRNLAGDDVHNVVFAL